MLRPRVEHGLAPWLGPVLILIWHGLWCGPFLAAYLEAPLIGGADGEAHYALARVYAENIFPAPFGWTQAWNAGMPWPLGYPPFFHYVMAVLAQAVPADFLHLFQGVIASLFFLFPLTLYFAARSFGLRRMYATFSALLGSLWLCSTDVAGGVAVASTFASGLYPQFVAAFVFVVWLGFFVRQQSIALTASAVLLSVILLTNAHVAEAALLVLAIFAVVDGASGDWRSQWRKYLASPALSVGLAAFWLLPFLSTLPFFPYKTFPPVGWTWIVASPFLALLMSLGILGGATAVYAKEARWAALFAASILLLGVSTVPLGEWVPEMPLQPARLVPLASLLFILLAAAFFQLLRQVWRVGRGVIVTGMIGTVAAGAVTQPRLSATMLPSLLDSDSEQLARFLGGLDAGRSVVEVWNFAFPVHYTVAAQAGLSARHNTLWNVFRESTISAPFIAPVRNWFSTEQETFGVPCYLCGAGNTLTSVDIDERLERSRLYDIRYFAVRSPTIVREFLGSSQVSPLKRFGDWLVFELHDDPGYVEELREDPAIVFTRLETRFRPERGPRAYDWLRLNEEWLRLAGPRVVLGLARDLDLDDTRDLDSFRTAVIFDYEAADEDRAHDRLLRWVEAGNRLVLFTPETSSTLYSRLSAVADQRNIIALDRSGIVGMDMRRLSEVLRVPATTRQTVPVSDVEFRDSSVSFAGERRSSGNRSNRAFYIKMSYFPWWSDTLGGAVYMASPANMLVVTPRDRVKLTFELPAVFWWGATITFMSIALGGAWTWRRAWAPVRPPTPSAPLPGSGLGN